MRGTLLGAASQSVSTLTPCSAVIGSEPAGCLAELRPHVGPRPLTTLRLVRIPHSEHTHLRIHSAIGCNSHKGPALSLSRLVLLSARTGNIPRSSSVGSRCKAAASCRSGGAWTWSWHFIQYRNTILQKHTEQDMIFNSAAVSTLRFYHQFPRYVHSVALCFYISLHLSS